MSTKEHNRKMMIFALRENGVEVPDNATYQEAKKLLRSVKFKTNN